MGLTACGESLPLEERIASIRPLAMRVEVIEPPGEPPSEPPPPSRAEALPFERVRVLPFVVDPSGPLDDEALAAFDPLWIRCSMLPYQGLFSCLSEALPLDPESMPVCPPVTFGDLGDELELPPSPCVLETATPVSPDLDIPLDPLFLLGGDIELTMVAHLPGEGSTRACLSALLSEEQLPESCFLMVQRVAVGPDGQLLTLARDFGIDIEGYGAIPDEIPEPDRHPRILRVTVDVFDEDGRLVATHDVPRGATIAAEHGQRLEIEAVAPADDLQTYLVPKDRTAFEERDEAYDGRWYRNWGDLLSPVSNDPESINTWVLVPGEQDPIDAGPPDGRATLYYVLRDGRQGVDWWWLDVEVSGGP